MPFSSLKTCCCTLLLATIVVASAAAQDPLEVGPALVESSPVPIGEPLVEPEVLPLPPADVSSADVLPETPLTGDPLRSTEATDKELATLLFEFPFGYNLREDSTTWLVGGGDNFGMFSLESLPSLGQDQTWGVVSGIGIHWLNGPVQTDMPPRLFDFQLGLQKRKWTSDTFGYDVAARVGIFSDFEGSAREGLRYPGHAVGYYRWTPGCDFVFGVEYLGRDDVKLLPVAGLILTPRPDLRFELVFPRPSIEVRISPESSIYVAGELGGGTWAIERVPTAEDVATYHALQLVCGYSRCNEEGKEHSIELGFIFDRSLKYRSGVGDMSLGDALMIRATQRY